MTTLSEVLDGLRRRHGFYLDRELAQIDHGSRGFQHCPKEFGGETCLCGADQHNVAVADALLAIEALVAAREIR